MLKRNFKIVLDTAQSLKITVLSTAAMNAPPNLFNSVNIRHFDYLLFLYFRGNPLCLIFIRIEPKTQVGEGQLRQPTETCSRTGHE